jgi:hypothetical protein
MSFLRRLLGRGDAEPEPTATPASNADLEEAERAHERDLMRAEAERLDELRQRQLRYAEHAWTPPDQGGERRADDEDASARE